MIAPQKRVHNSEEQLQLDRLTAGLSRRFTDLDAAEVDREIEAAQKLICETLGLDRSALGQWDETSQVFTITHSWAEPGFQEVHQIRTDGMPWIAAKILGGEAVSFARVSDLPEVAAKDKEALGGCGQKSSVAFPLRAGGRVFGALMFSTLHAECEWPGSLVDRLSIIADVFVGALARKLSGDLLITSRIRAKEAVRNSEDLFRTVANSAPVLIWMSGPDKQCNFFNEIWLRFTGRTMQEEMGQGWASGVHLDDLARCLEVYSAAFDARVEFEMEYRLRRFDGEYRWVVDRGVPSFDSDGAFRGYVGSCIDITDRKITAQALIDMNERLLDANQRIEKLKEQLEQENVYLLKEITLERIHHEVVGRSEGIRRVLMNAEQVAPTGSNVLLLGETGTGKELIAKAIHQNSKRKDRLMVKVNCAALPASLVESELFGREKGAYTGALTREIGRFELADGSTIFLDEVGELPLELQAKLLRVLQEGEFERLGSPRTIRVDARLIAATSRDLEAAVKEGKFREDLYYRLNVFPIHIPPLRERREDIPMLTWHFLRELGGRMGREVETVRAATMKAFQSYSWPGNVRELRNVIERHLITNPGPVFEAELPEAVRNNAPGGGTLAEVERNHIRRVLEGTGWRVRGPGGAAEVLGLKATTLESRMERLGIVRK